jgi:hypothetical protein
VGHRVGSSLQEDRQIPSLFKNPTLIPPTRNRTLYRLHYLVHFQNHTLPITAVSSLRNATTFFPNYSRKGRAGNTRVTHNSTGVYFLATTLCLSSSFFFNVSL